LFVVCYSSTAYSVATAIQYNRTTAYQRTMGSKARKKKRVAKHILVAHERKRLEEEGRCGPETAVVSPTGTTPIKKKKKRRKKQHIKDPKEAQSYLSAWKYRDAAPGTWKFNKNTQSWLFRHMYDSEKTPKASFAILMDYLQGLKGSSREWANEDAVKRVVRYKEWEKKGAKTDDGASDAEQVSSTPEEKEKVDDDNDDDDNDDVNADNKFKSLSDHDKRKEYKRARKVVETLKEES